MIKAWPGVEDVLSTRFGGPVEVEQGCWEGFHLPAPLRLHLPQLIKRWCCILTERSHPLRWSEWTAVRPPPELLVLLYAIQYAGTPFRGTDCWDGLKLIGVSSLKIGYQDSVELLEFEESMRPH